MKNVKKIKTPIGIISIYKNEIPESYQCTENPEIVYLDETHIRIRTIDQAVAVM